MNLGFINIPFPVLIFLVIIVINVIGTIIKKQKADERPSVTPKKKSLDLIAYDFMMRKKREADRDCFTEEFVDEELNADFVPEVVKVEQKVQPQKSVKRNQKFTLDLSQLQQAVVMKEILDKPKSLQ
ncbi:MAG: hypothetical protein KAG98_01045 [Lentisphaeria bacterium]|nr:hypothetical protein [Lentisphaeria bacterium]